LRCSSVRGTAFLISIQAGEFAEHEIERKENCRTRCNPGLCISSLNPSVKQTNPSMPGNQFSEYADRNTSLRATLPISGPEVSCLRLTSFEGKRRIEAEPALNISERQFASWPFSLCLVFVNVNSFATCVLSTIEMSPSLSYWKCPMMVRMPPIGAVADGIGSAAPVLLFLKQIFKRPAGIARAQAGWRGCFLLARYAEFVEGAIVARIFFLDALRYRLHALKAAAGVKVGALFAGVKFEPALGAKPAGRHAWQHRPALRAAGYGPRAWHVYGFRPHAVVAPCRRYRNRLFSRLLARLFFPVTVLISMLTVFGCHRNLPKHAGVLSRQPRSKTSPNLLSLLIELVTRCSIVLTQIVATHFATIRA
jgi:hypothetical protein